MNIGYARTSTTEQNIDLQVEELKKAGCDRIFTDQESGIKEDRKGLLEAIAFCREGDVLIVWKLDRAGRSLRHLIEIVNTLNERKIGFRCLTQQLDTTTPAGMLIFHVFGAMAEFEKSLIAERTALGREAARARGRMGGRPKVLDSKKSDVARQLYDGKKTSVAEICATLGISRSTFYRSLKAA
jgi:DNA invertase Pin-like site-specific DNA recombinase